MKAALLSSRAISRMGDRVVKIQEPAASRRERLRTQAGREVGLETGLFVVPDVVSFDDEQGEIVFEWLRLTGLRQMLSEGGKSLELAGRAARALAAIHAQSPSDLDSRPVTGPLAAISSARVPVPVHGDYCMRNLFCLAETDRIAIIDWSNADWLKMEGDLGAPEIDLAVFLISLFHRRLLGPLPIPRRHEVARHFLRTYGSASSHGIDWVVLRKMVAALTPAFARLTRRRKGRLHAFACRHSLIDLDFFLRRSSHSG